MQDQPFRDPDFDADLDPRDDVTELLGAQNCRVYAVDPIAKKNAEYMRAGIPLVRGADGIDRPLPPPPPGVGLPPMTDGAASFINSLYGTPLPPGYRFPTSEEEYQESRSLFRGVFWALAITLAAAWIIWGLVELFTS